MEKVGKDMWCSRLENNWPLKELLTSLDKEERKLIYLRYFAEKTQTQVGKEMGISGSGFQNGKENIKKSKRTYLTGTS